MRRREEPRTGERPAVVDPPRDAPREAAGADRSGAEPAEAAGVVRLRNRIALLTFATAFAVIAGLVALPTAFSSATGLARLAAVVPIAAAALGIVAVWRSRVMLRAVLDGERVRASRT